MAAPVPRDKDDGLPVKRPEAEFVRGSPERALDPAPLGTGEAVDLVEAAAADDADNAAGHSPIRAARLAIEITTETRRARRFLEPPCPPCLRGENLDQCTRDQILRLA